MLRPVAPRDRYMGFLLLALALLRRPYAHRRRAQSSGPHQVQPIGPGIRHDVRGSRRVPVGWFCKRVAYRRWSQARLARRVSGAALQPEAVLLLQVFALVLP